jgi:acetyltransferase
MSIRNLEAIFRPNSVALIGVSPKPNSVGRVVMDNLLGGDFPGPVFLVNPKYRGLWDLPVYPNVESLPVVPNLTVICTPSATVPSLVAQLSESGCRGSIVITAGFGEVGTDAGRAAEQQLLNAARPHLHRII